MTEPKALRFPPVPRYKTKQRYGARFWDTDAMLQALAVEFGCSATLNPRSWQYRLLVSAHRQQNTHNAFRQGYGPDWRAEIKPGLLEYLHQGRLPMEALKLAAAQVREVERLVWVRARALRAEHALLDRVPSV